MYWPKNWSKCPLVDLQTSPTGPMNDFCWVKFSHSSVSLVLNANRFDSFIDLDLQFLAFQKRVSHYTKKYGNSWKRNIFLVNNNCKEQLCRQIESKQCRWTKDVSIEGTVIKNFNEKPEKKVKKVQNWAEMACYIDWILGIISWFIWPWSLMNYVACDRGRHWPCHLPLSIETIGFRQWSIIRQILFIQWYSLCSIFYAISQALKLSLCLVTKKLLSYPFWPITKFCFQN